MSHAHAIGVMDQLASQTWHLLRACYDRKIRVDEDAITTQLLIAIATQLGGTLVMADGRKDESFTGCDFELWVANHGPGWRAYVIQAKRITLPTADYRKLRYRVGKKGAFQHDLLRNHGKTRHATPLYLFYNHWDSVLSSGKHPFASTAPMGTEYGCSITSLSTARRAIDKARYRNYLWLHQQASTKPWSSLLLPPAPPSVPPGNAAGIAAIVTGGASGNDEDPLPPRSSIEIDAIVDSNEHATLPTHLLRYVDGPGVYSGLDQGDSPLQSRAALILGRNALR